MVNRRRDALRFHVQLLGIEPPIWRELLVPARYSFWDLHVAIQDAMGWRDCHLHEFHVPTHEGASTVVFGIPNDEGLELHHEVKVDWDHAVVDFASEPGSVLRYDYDFGDGWTHSIRLLAIEPRDKGLKYPRCTKGERACPPEDCGGVDGYAELVSALLDPKHPEFEMVNDWIPRGWSPETFDPSAVHFYNPKARWRWAFGEEEWDWVRSTT